LEDAIKETKALVKVDIAQTSNTVTLIVPLVVSGVVATMLALYCIRRNHKKTENTIQDVRKSVKLGSKQFKHIHNALSTMNEGTFEMVYPEQDALEPRADSDPLPVLSRSRAGSYTTSTHSDSAPLLSSTKEGQDPYVTPTTTPSRSPSMVLTFKRASILPSFEETEAASLEEINTEIAQEQEEERRQGSLWSDGSITLAKGRSLSLVAGADAISSTIRKASVSLFPSKPGPEAEPEPVAEPEEEQVVVPRPPIITTSTSTSSDTRRPDMTTTATSSSEMHRWTEEDGEELSSREASPRFQVRRVRARQNSGNI